MRAADLVRPNSHFLTAILVDRRRLTLAWAMTGRPVEPVGVLLDRLTAGGILLFSLDVLLRFLGRAEADFRIIKSGISFNGFLLTS